jgi:hypothetical protein
MEKKNYNTFYELKCYQPSYDTQFVLYPSIIYLVLYLKHANALLHQYHMKSVTSARILAGYSVKNISYILKHYDLLQQSLELTLRIHNSYRSSRFLKAVASSIDVPLVKEIKEAFRHLVRMRTIRPCQTPYYVELAFKE